MKRHLISLFTAGLVMASCAVNEIKEDTSPTKEITPITASIGTETKTALGAKEDNAYKAVWTYGDRILVVDSEQNRSIYSTQSHRESIGLFFPEEGEEVLDFSKGIIAGYPAENMIISRPDISEGVFFSIPEVQTYIKDNFETDLMPMVSDVSTTQDIAFKNVGGVMKFMISTSLPGIKIKTITITAENEFISGECGYIPETQEFFYDDMMVGSNTVTLDCGNNGVRISSTPTAFHVVVHPQEYTKLSICIKAHDGREQIFNLKEDKTLDVARSSVKTISLTADNVAQPTYPIVNMSVTETDFKNLKVSISMKNIKSYFCGLMTKKAFESSLENDFIPNLDVAVEHTSPFNFSGSILKFQSEFDEIVLDPGQTYILWIVPCNEDGIYTIDDIFTLEATTKSFLPGGTLEVSTADHDITMEKIGMTVSAPGARFIYSMLVPTYELRELGGEEEIIMQLFRPGGYGTSFDRASDWFERRHLRPGSEMTFLSVAVDYNGYYGPLLMEEYQTIPIEYNTLVVEIEKDIDKLKENGGILNWNVTGGEASSYRYFFKETENVYWTDTYERDYTMIQETMITSPGLFYFSSTNNNNAQLSELKEGTEYVFVVLAVEDNENWDSKAMGYDFCSEADFWIFTY